MDLSLIVDGIKTHKTANCPEAHAPTPEISSRHVQGICGPIEPPCHLSSCNLTSPRSGDISHRDHSELVSPPTSPVMGSNFSKLLSSKSSSAFTEEKFHKARLDQVGHPGSSPDMGSYHHGACLSVQHSYGLVTKAHPQLETELPQSPISTAAITPTSQHDSPTVPSSRMSSQPTQGSQNPSLEPSPIGLPQARPGIPMQMQQVHVQPHPVYQSYVPYQVFLPQQMSNNIHTIQWRPAVPQPLESHSSNLYYSQPGPAVHSHHPSPSVGHLPHNRNHYHSHHTGRRPPSCTNNLLHYSCDTTAEAVGSNLHKRSISPTEHSQTKNYKRLTRSSASPQVQIDKSIPITQALSEHILVLETFGGQRNKFSMKTRQFACQDCGRSFFRKSDLVRHIQIHLGIRPNTCKVCGKQFIQRSALTVHQRVHTGEKPYSCQVCGRAFSDSSSLARHRRIHIRNQENRSLIPEINSSADSHSPEPRRENVPATS